jgi:soluble lytic murein transglycosylase-like protein
MEKPNQSQPVPQSVQNRFVELLEKKEEPRKDDKEEHKEKTRGIPGLLPGKTKAGASASMDDLRRSISRSADKYNIDEELIRAVIQVESGWKADAVSVKGAMGLMQLMPRTASMLGVEDAFDPGQNIEGGVKYLAQLTDKYKGDVEKALAAYNAGPSRVDAAGGAPFPETARYVRNVMALYHRYREED